MGPKRKDDSKLSFDWIFEKNNYFYYIFTLFG
jgi:hypothetical protein